MSKLIIVSDSASEAVKRAEGFGLTREDISIVTNLDKMRGHKDMLMVYAGQPYKLDDFFDIVQYAGSHNIKCLKLNDPTKDTQEEIK